MINKKTIIPKDPTNTSMNKGLENSRNIVKDKETVNSEIEKSLLEENTNINQLSNDVENTINIKNPDDILLNLKIIGCIKKK